MAIIRNTNSKFTAELTEVELLLYLIVHFKLHPDKAEESLIKNAKDGNIFCVRLPPEVDSLRKLAKHLQETRELDDLSETYLKLVLNEIMFDPNVHPGIYLTISDYSDNFSNISIIKDSPTKSPRLEIFYSEWILEYIYHLYFYK